MKVSTSISKGKNFQPFTLTVDIETREELDSLIARLAIGTAAVNKELNDGNYFLAPKERATLKASFELFKYLYNLKHGDVVND